MVLSLKSAAGAEDEVGGTSLILSSLSAPAHRSSMPPPPFSLLKSLQLASEGVHSSTAAPKKQSYVLVSSFFRGRDGGTSGEPSALRTKQQGDSRAL